MSDPFGAPPGYENYNTNTATQEPQQQQAAAQQHEPQHPADMPPQQRVPYMHMSTRNQSFLQMASILYQMGVQNYAFMLCLYDSRLQNVDPHDPTLSDDLKLAVVKECLINPWYYLREAVRVNISGGTAPFKLNRGNVAMIYMVLCNVKSITILPRQCYKTSSMAAVASWIYQYIGRNYEMAFFNKAPGNSKENLRRVKDILDALPGYLKIKTKGDTDNVESVRCALNNNSIQTHWPAANPEAADNKGRGFSYPWIWYDESEWTKYIDITYYAAAPTASEAGDQARQNGFPHGVHQTTTPNNIDTPEAAFVEGRVIKEAIRFQESFYDLPYDQLHSMIYNMTTNNAVHVEFSWQEMGFTEKWYEAQCRELENNRQKIDREINLKRSVSNNTCPYPEELIFGAEQHIASSYQDIRVHGLWIFKMLCPPDPNRPVLFTVDPATGGGGDSTAIVIWDLPTMMPIGYFDSNRIRPEQTIDIINNMISSVFPHSLVQIERNLDQTMINLFYNGPYGNCLLREERTKMVEVREDNSMVKGRRGRQTVWELGFNTDKTNRKLMYETTLFQALENEPEALRIAKVVQEIRLLEERNGRIEARRGYHDDMLMAWLIGYHMYYNPQRYPQFSKRRRDMIRRWMARPESADPETNQQLLSQKQSQIKETLGYTKQLDSIRQVNRFIQNVKMSDNNPLDSIFEMQNMSGVDMLTGQMLSNMGDSYQMPANPQQYVNARNVQTEEGGSIDIDSDRYQEEIERKKQNQTSRQLKMLRLNRRSSSNQLQGIF